MLIYYVHRSFQYTHITIMFYVQFQSVIFYVISNVSPLSVCMHVCFQEELTDKEDDAISGLKENKMQSELLQLQGEGHVLSALS